jgi:pimeloyl-ACP methyl ester carboxylesterase
MTTQSPAGDLSIPWKPYVHEVDIGAIARDLRTTTFVSRGETFELVCFEHGPDEPSILISPGSAGHAYVFVELAWEMRQHGFNVFIMPRQGGYDVSTLVARHEDAIAHVERSHADRIGIFGEGLGGYATFYLALAHGPAKSIVCMNSPALLNEPAFQEAALHEDERQGWKRRVLVPVLTRLARVMPNLPIPIRAYLDFRQMIDTAEPSRTFEKHLIDTYMSDPGFDRTYPLSAVLSMLTTPPPLPLEDLRTPTMFLVPTRGFAPGYTHDLFARLPDVRKKLVEVDGSVFWMVSHPADAARIVCEWFAETLR